MANIVFNDLHFNLKLTWPPPFFLRISKRQNASGMLLTTKATLITTLVMNDVEIPLLDFMAFSPLQHVNLHVLRALNN